MRKTSEKSENLKHANLDNELIILPLDEADDLSFFNCNSEELNDFLKNNALLDQNNLVNRTRLCFCNGSLAGFYSLAADTIETKNVIDGIESYPYRKYSAVKIARLAVDSRLERCGIGTFLVIIQLPLFLTYFSAILNAYYFHTEYYKNHSFRVLYGT